MDWITLLKAQQADFLQRLKKPKTYELSLLDSQVKGCHSEIMAFWGEQLEKMLEYSRQQAEIVSKNPPPQPPEYPDPPYWMIPFEEYFQQQADDYLLREQIVHRVISERLGKLVKKVPIDTVANMILDDEGNLRGESKFSYFLAAEPSISIQVHATDGESFNSVKKDKVKWSVTEDDIKNHQILIFLCLFYPFSGQRGYEKQVLMTGFLPTNQIEFSGSKRYISPSNLLYWGGLSWYLESVIKPKDAPPEVDEIVIPETIETLPPNHLLKRLGGNWECSQTFKGHSRGINCLAFNPDGKILASGSRGETKLWDVTAGELQGTLSEYPWIAAEAVNEVNSLAFSPDGQILVSGGADATIKIWHLRAEDLIDILDKHHAMVRCVAFYLDGQILATGGDDRKILFWDLLKRKVAFSLCLDDSAAHSLALSQDGQTLVVGSYRKIKVWGLQAGRKTLDATLLHTLTGHSHIVCSLALSADGKLLVSACRDKTIKIWQLETGELIQTIKGHTDAVYAIALSPDGQTIASGSADKTVKLWHLQTGEVLGTFTGHTNTVSAVAFSPDGHILASASLDKKIKIWQRC